MTSIAPAALETNSCITCDEAVEDPFLTGAVCSVCASDSSSEKLAKGANSKLSIGALITAAIPFAVQIEINGLNYVAVACGAIAIVLGLVALVRAIKAQSNMSTTTSSSSTSVGLNLGGIRVNVPVRGTAIPVAFGAMALGAFQLFVSGLF